jgi:hypothetical protein
VWRFDLVCEGFKKVSLLTRASICGCASLARLGHSSSLMIREEVHARQSLVRGPKARIGGVIDADDDGNASIVRGCCVVEESDEDPT